jgi:hypothetical protein
MKTFRWSPDKNAALADDRSLSFENIIVAIESGGLLDILDHPNKAKSPNQRVMIVTFNIYVFLVPYIEEKDHYFLKTIIPSRKATKDYLNQGEPNV